MATSKKLQRAPEVVATGTLCQSDRKSHSKQALLSKRRGLRRHVPRSTSIDENAKTIARVCISQLEDLARECHSLINHLTYEPNNTLVLGGHWERWEKLVSAILVPDEEILPSDGETVGYPSQHRGVHGEDEGDGTRDNPYRCPEESD